MNQIINAKIDDVSFSIKIVEEFEVGQPKLLWENEHGQEKGDSIWPEDIGESQFSEGPTEATIHVQDGDSGGILTVKHSVSVNGGDAIDKRKSGGSLIDKDQSQEAVSIIL